MNSSYFSIPQTAYFGTPKPQSGSSQSYNENQQLNLQLNMFQLQAIMIATELRSQLEQLKSGSCSQVQQDLLNGGRQYSETEMIEMLKSMNEGDSCQSIRDKLLDLKRRRSSTSTQSSSSRVNLHKQEGCSDPYRSTSCSHQLQVLRLTSENNDLRLRQAQSIQETQTLRQTYEQMLDAMQQENAELSQRAQKMILDNIESLQELKIKKEENDELQEFVVAAGERIEQIENLYQTMQEQLEGQRKQKQLLKKELLFAQEENQENSRKLRKVIQAYEEEKGNIRASNELFVELEDLYRQHVINSQKEKQKLQEKISELEQANVKLSQQQEFSEKAKLVQTRSTWKVDGLYALLVLMLTCSAFWWGFL